MSKDITVKINDVIETYFKENPKKEWIPVKEIMPHLIKAGVFAKDNKKGLPLRKVLRALDKENKLDKIPSVHAERKESNVYWYLVQKGFKYVSQEPVKEVTRKQKAISRRESSDEYYLIGLINELLDTKASHQHTFNFLLGDLHKNGKKRTELPLDAYYKDLNLVVEFIMKEDSDSDEHADKEEKMTISGVSRSEQRRIYRLRKRSVLKEEEINLIEIEYEMFECDNNNKLVRNKECDIQVLQGLLKNYIK